MNMQPNPRQDRAYTFFKMTQSVCPECLKVIQAQVVFENNRVYFLKFCPEHGHSKALVSEDADYYKKAYGFTRPGSMPKHFSTEVKHGCPDDCGLCSSHQQHTCLPIIEITDYCNLACPVCIVDNHHANHMAFDDFCNIIDRLIEYEGFLETITLSGGEPTMHPRFFDFVDYARARPEVERVSVVTNGIRLAQSREFCEQIKAKNVYVILQLDGFSEEAHEAIRGKQLQAVKNQALAHLAEFDIATQISFVAVRHINEHQLGDAVQMLLERDHVLSLIVQPVSYSGQGGGVFPHDPLDRLTIPGIIHRIDEQTRGMVAAEDFIPLPCSHPLCVSLTYLLKLNDGSYLPFPRFIDMEQHLDLFQQTATIRVDGKTEDALQKAISDLWSTAGEVPNCDKVLHALKRALIEMYPGKELPPEELTRIAERQAKTIFIHHYMDRHDLDVERLMKCCHHYPQIDGRIMPACSFNMFYRGAAKGSDTPVAAHRQAPFGTSPLSAIKVSVEP